MALNAGYLDRRVQFRRPVLVDDGVARSHQWHNYGAPVFAARRDVSDSEKFAGDRVQATLDTRFIVRSSSFTRKLRPTDRLVSEGLDFNIIGIKQLGRQDFLEFSCKAAVT